MIKWHKALFILVFVLVVSLSLQKWLYIIGTSKHRSVSLDFEQLKAKFNATSRNILKCDPKFLPDFNAMSKSGYSIALDDNSRSKFTVLMRTFDRLHSIREAVLHYVCMSSVDRLILLWSNQKVKPPSAQFFNATCPEKLIVKALPASNLTLRFYPFKEIRTDGIFSLDDDILLSEQNLEHAFEVWKNYSWGLVGQFERGHSGYLSQDMTYGSMENGYSLILTGAAFIHREYFRMFQDKCVSKIREDIDRNNNCEDIFMNFLVKEHCRCSGIFHPKHGKVTTPRNFVLKNALSSRPNHYMHRSKCLQKYAALFANSVTLTKSKCTY